MELILIKARWKYDDSETVVGICEKERVKDVQAKYKNLYHAVQDSITFITEEYILNAVYA